MRALIKLKGGLLAESVVNFLAPSMDSDNPYFTAAWKLYCEQKVNNNQLASQSSIDKFVINANVKVNKLDLFLWAALYGYNMTDITYSEPLAFQAALQSDLLTLITEQIRTHPQDSDLLQKVLQIFNNLFACLLKVGGEGGLPYNLGIKIVQSRYPPHPDWPENVCLLDYLWNNDINASQLDILFTNTFWSELSTLDHSGF